MDRTTPRLPAGYSFCPTWGLYSPPPPLFIDLSGSADFRALSAEDCRVTLEARALDQGLLRLSTPRPIREGGGLRIANRPGEVLQPAAAIPFSIDPYRSVNPELADLPDLRRALRDALQFAPSALARREAEEMAELTSNGNVGTNLSQNRTGGRL